MNKRLLIKIEGSVQGVFFRNWVCKSARYLQLTGWVANKDDGSVHILAEGCKDNLDSLYDLCQKGPPAAKVHHVTAHWSKYQNTFDNFTIKW